MFFTFRLDRFTNQDIQTLPILTIFVGLVVWSVDAYRLRSLRTSINLSTSPFASVSCLSTCQAYSSAHTKLGFFFLPAEFNHVSL